jgi:hypothetical protein
MKYFILLFICFLTQLTFSQQKPDDKSQGLFDIDKIILNSTNNLNKNPVIVLNEQKISKADLQSLNLKNKEISKLRIIPKDNMRMVDVYGLESLNGVVMIESGFFLSEYNIKYSTPKNKMLYIVNNEIIKEKDFSNIESSIIKEFKIVKDKKLMTEYTKDNYDAILLITTE